MNTTVIIIIATMLCVFIGVVLLLKPATKGDVDASNRLEDIKQENGNVQESTFQKIVKQATTAKNNTNQVNAAKTIAEFVDSKVKPTIPEGRNGRAVNSNDAEIKKLLALANINISMRTFNILRILLAVVLALVVNTGCKLFAGSVMNSQAILLLTLATGLFGTLLPKTIVAQTVKKRRNAISSTMPDVIDLITMSVEAGMNYDQAIEQVWRNNQSAAMEELVRTMDDIDYGMTKKQAYRSLSARCELEEVTAFATNMGQADALGVPIVNVLKAQVEMMRKSKRRKVEALISQAPIKMMFPLVFFIFPSILVVLLGPTIDNLSLLL